VRSSEQLVFRAKLAHFPAPKSIPEDEKSCDCPRSVVSPASSRAQSRFRAAATSNQSGRTLNATTEASCNTSLGQCDSIGIRCDSLNDAREVRNR